VIHKIHTYIHKNESSTVKWAQWDKTQSRELLGLFICVCIALCTTVAHKTAQNRPDNFHLTLQTTTTAPIMSIWGKGGGQMRGGSSWPFLREIHRSRSEVKVQGHRRKIFIFFFSGAGWAESCIGEVSWSLTSLFSTNTAISETKGQGWKVIRNQWRKASDILTSTLAAFLFSSHPKKGKGSRGSFKLLR